MLSHGNMFWLYIQPSSGLKEISPGTKNVYFMGSMNPIKYTFNHHKALKKSVQAQKMCTLWDP